MTAIACSWGRLPNTGVLLTASCVQCGGEFRAICGNEQTAARSGVDHRCGTGVVGPLWVLIQPPAARVRRPRPSVENAA